jgi:hypothetical protein
MKVVVILAVFMALSVASITGRLAEHNPITRVLLYLDIFLCSLLLASPDLTISSRCGLALRAGHPWPLCGLGRALNWLAPNHCENAIANDIRRARVAIERLLGD